MTVEGTSVRERRPLVSAGRSGAAAGSRHEAITEAAWRAERAAYYGVIRWRTIYERARPRMARMHPSTAATFHHRLKAREYDAIGVHQAAEGDGCARLAVLRSATGRVEHDGRAQPVY